MPERQHFDWPENERVETVPVAEAQIHWVCRAEAHRTAPSRGGRGGLTVFLGKWAYCDGQVDDDLHEWAPTGGVTIDRLIDWKKALGPYRGMTVRR